MFFKIFQPKRANQVQMDQKKVCVFYRELILVVTPEYIEINCLGHTHKNGLDSWSYYQVFLNNGTLL